MYSLKSSRPMAHKRSSPLMVFRFSRWHLSLALHNKGELVTMMFSTSFSRSLTVLTRARCSIASIKTYSLVIKEMNSETHSWTVSFASFAILAFAGRFRFIMRLMFAMGRKRSCSLRKQGNLRGAAMTRLKRLFMEQVITYLVAPPSSRDPSPDIARRQIVFHQIKRRSVR